MWNFIQKRGQIRVWIPHPLIIHTIAHYSNLFSLCLCSANSYFFIFFFGFVQYCARCARNTVFSSSIALNSWMRQTNSSIFTLKALWRFSTSMFLKFKNIIWNVGCTNIIEAAILLNASRPLNHFEHILNRGITFVDKEVTFNNRYLEEKVEEWSYKKSEESFWPLLQSNFVNHHYQPSPLSSKSPLPS